MSDCIICFENKKKFLKCFTCSKITCKKCLKRYKKYECCNCNEVFLEKDIKLVFGDDIIEKYIYYYLYKKFFLNNNFKEIITQHFARLENQKYLRFGFIKNNLEKKIIKRCFNEKCKGVFYDKNCSICSNKICINCEEPFHENNCDPEILKNLEEIKLNCKKCPFCFIYINKTIGCNSMKCTNCGVSFNWRNLEIDNKTQNDEHYNTILNKDLNQFFLQHFKDNKFVKKDEEVKPEKILYFRFLTNQTFLSEQYKTMFINLHQKFKQKKKNLKKNEIEYLLKIENLLKENIENNLDSSFDTIDFKICKNLYIEDKAYNFMLSVLEGVEKIFVEKKPFNINIVEELINQYNDENILFEKSLYVLKNDKIVLNKIIKTQTKTFELYEKKNYFNNGKINLLDEEQLKHAKNVFDNLNNFNICLNSSYAGSGKTYVSLFVASKLKIKNLIIIVPNIMAQKWKDLIEYYNYKNKFNYLILNFNELYNKNFEENNNLFKKIYKTQTKSIIQFSEYFLQFINDETMFIIDEIHNSKKSSAVSTQFIQKLAKVVKKQNGYVLGISATPLEKDTEVELILKKISGIKEFKNKDLNKYKVCLNHKKYLESIYNVLNDGKTTKKNNLNGDDNSESEDENVNLFFKKQICNKNYISGKKLKKLQDIQETIVFKTAILKQNFFEIFKFKLSLKDKMQIEKITNLLKNLLIVYKLTPTEIFEEAKTINTNYIYARDYGFNNPLLGKYLENPENKNLDNNNNLFFNMSKSFLEFFKIKYENFKDKRFEEEYKNITDKIFKRNLMEYFVRVKDETSIYIDLSTIQYKEEIGFKLYYIFFYNTISGYHQSCINILTLFYLFKFNIYETFYFGSLSLDNIILTLLKIVLKKINYNVKTNQLENINYLKNLYYLNFNLKNEDKKVLEYAFTNIDVKTNKKINKNSLYFISTISKGLEQTETLYINYFLTLIDIFYPLNKFKIVLAVSFTNTINDFKKKLTEEKKKYLVINGEVKNKDKVIKMFNENDEENLLIVNINSLNCGVDLDDKKGTKPRLVFIIPNFSLTTLVQFIFRFKRKDTLSEPYIYIINNHSTILKALVNKFKNIHNLNLDTPFIKEIKTKNDNEIIEELI